MTNIVAIILWTITTGSWSTVSVTSPMGKPMFDSNGLPIRNITLEYRPTQYNQSASVTSNQVMRIEWEGITKDLIIKSIDIGNISRSTYQ